MIRYPPTYDAYNPIHIYYNVPEDDAMSPGPAAALLYAATSIVAHNNATYR